MKRFLQFTILTFTLSATAAQFKNLDFESAKPPKNPGFEDLSAAVALPSWHTFTGTVEEVSVLFKSTTTGSARVKLGEFVPVSTQYGKYGVGLLSGGSIHGEGAVSAGIWQAGDVPANARTLLFDTSIDLSKTTGYRVSMEGVTLSLQPVMTGMAGTDISAFAGKTVELRFESLFEPAFGAFQVDFSLDNIRFSSVALVPEPSTWALLGVGGGLLFWVARRPKEM